MSQVLLSSQHKTLPGKFFHCEDDITMDWPINYVRHRVRLESGKGKEIDLLGSIGTNLWVCQSKWVTDKKIGVDVLRSLLMQAEMAREDRKPPVLRIWLFAHDGLSPQALELAEEQGVLWSTREDLDGLLEYLGLRKLPEL